MIMRRLSAIRIRIAVLMIPLFFLLIAAGCGPGRIASKNTPVDENLAQLNRSARIAFDNRQLEQAANLYRQALDRAYLHDDRKAVADAQYNLAVCNLEMGSYDKALVWVNQAKNESVRAEQSVTIDMLFLEAAILFRTGKLDRAWQITDQILSAPERSPATVISKTRFLRGLISDQRGQTDQLSREIDAMTKSADPGKRADREELIGRLAMAEGRWDTAIEAMDLTARLRSENLDYRKMAQALSLAADACQRSGKPSEAAKRYFRAGRSAVQQGNSQDAKKWLNSAVQLAGQAGDEPLEQEVRAFLRRMPTP